MVMMVRGAQKKLITIELQPVCMAVESTSCFVRDYRAFPVAGLQFEDVIFI